MFLKEEWDVITKEEEAKAKLEDRDPVPIKVSVQGGKIQNMDPNRIAYKVFVRSPIALSPYKSFGFAGKQWSPDSILWICGLEKEQNISIQHALNGGEKRAYITGHNLSLGRVLCGPPNRTGSSNGLLGRFSSRLSHMLPNQHC